MKCRTPTITNITSHLLFYSCFLILAEKTNLIYSTHLHASPTARFTTAVLMKKIQSRSHMTQTTQSWSYGGPGQPRLTKHRRAGLMRVPATFIIQRLPPFLSTASAIQLIRRSEKETASWEGMREGEEEGSEGGREGARLSETLSEWILEQIST